MKIFAWWNSERERGEERRKKTKKDEKNSRYFALLRAFRVKVWYSNLTV